MADIVALLAEAAQLSGRAAALAAEGRVDEALALGEEAEKVRRRARRAAQTSRLRDGLDGISPALEGTSTTRQTTIASLNEIGVPTSPRMISQYAAARFGSSVDYHLLAAMRRDERRAWASPRSSRPVYVVPALEGRRFLAMRGKFALSEWPLERRLIGPWSERVDHLTATVNLARQLAWLREAKPVEANRLALLVSASAGSITPMAQLDPTEIERAALAELEVLEPEDKKWREDAATRARRQLDEEQQLWGAAPPALVRESSG